MAASVTAMDPPGSGQGGVGRIVAGRAGDDAPAESKRASRWLARPVVRGDAQAGFGAGFGVGPGSVSPGARCSRATPWVFSLGGRSLNRASNSGASTVSSATSFSASASSRRSVGGEHLHRPLVGAVDDRADLLVDRLGDVIGVVPLLADLAAEEHELVALPERERAEPVAHAVLGDHPAGPVGRLLDVVRRARRGVAEDQPLGGIAPEHARRSRPRTRSCS